MAGRGEGGRGRGRDARRGRRPLIPAHGRLDRFGGKLLYRAVAILLAPIAIGAAAAAYFAALDGELIAAAIFIALSAGLCWLIRWCFSGRRRLHEAEWC